MRPLRAFTLIEAMVSLALLSVIGAGSLSLVSNVLSTTAHLRLKTTAAADLQTTTDRIYMLAAITSNYEQASTAFCNVLTTTDGPAAGTATSTSGTCPGESSTYTITVPISGTPLLRTISLQKVAAGSVDLTQVTVSIAGTGLQATQALTTLLPLAIGGT